ncbi:hypothetical protein GUJ93_ZPchr0007g5632 [Zizania palustris]|uniref:WRKY domain-containing protein n=1 Tax=Zizania palustris TaxID=103762 RepID=A0A8J5T305_ZIZPA|nr:hypothetical protein GUJ93_ZPchr0007g5632 [Zizania palustris]
MSSGGGGGNHHGLYHHHGHGQHHGREDGGADDYVYSNNDDMESFLFSHPGGADGGADEIMPYSSNTDYLLQGFLDPSGLARFDDVPCPDQATAPVVKQELSVDVTSHDSQLGATGEGVAPLLLATPNPSASFSSSDVGEAEGKSRRCKKGVRQARAEGEDGANSKKPNKPAKKEAAEKRQRQPRVAFLTKSDVDHLEDGYRWRKYGQKAVKNSSYPRSYYRCTTPKCGVKKRVERSYQDPSTVITTYEGQHTHHSPASLRGGGGHHFFMPGLHGGRLPPPHFMPEGFHPELRGLMMHNHPMGGGGGAANPSMYLPPTVLSHPPPPHPDAPMLAPDPLQQHHHFTDYAILQDLFPSTMPSNP